MTTRDYLYLPLYSYSKHEVLESSGLNAWNGNKPKNSSSILVRPEGEVYIPIPAELWNRKPFWVDPIVDMSQFYSYRDTTGNSSYEINLHFPDDSIYPAIFAQSGFKSLETDPQNALGKWILDRLGIKHPQRIAYDQPATNIVTMELLERLGVDSVKLWHEYPDNLKEVWIDFAEFGSFEKFMNGTI